ncbi:MAG: glycosyl hydrolase family 18 protein [Bacteroidia bacterium]
MKRALLLLTFCIITFLTIAQPCKEVVGYYPNWQWYKRNHLVQPSSIAYTKYSVINYCFFSPQGSGLIATTDSWADQNLLQGQTNWSTTPTSYYPNTSIIDLAHNAGTRVMVSVGGWTLSDSFPAIAASASKRAVFAGECNRLIRFYHFDGIDIDWEYPCYVAHSGTPGDKHNFTLLLQQIRDSITALGAVNHTTYRLSACFSADPGNASNIEWANISTILDRVNLMTYDFFGAWDAIANANSPLYAPVVGNPAYSINSAFLLLTQTYHVPSAKINLGVPFYGRSQTGATGLYQSTSGQSDNSTFSADAGSPSYYNVVGSMTLFNDHWDDTAKVPYLLGKPAGSAAGTFVSYDNQKSVALKAQYILNNNASGAIIWELTGDYMETSSGSGIVAGTPLLDTLNYAFCHPLSTDIKNEVTGTDLLLYPNPTEGRTTLMWYYSEPAVLEIYNDRGWLVCSQIIVHGENSLHLDNQAPGMYFIRAQAKDVYYNSKIVKQ